MITANKYNPSTPFSKLGERIVYLFLKTKGETIDVSDFNFEYDLLYKSDGEEHRIEVKYDSLINRTGNLFIEFISNVIHPKAGWFSTTKADIIFYGDSVTNDFYAFHMDRLREYINNENRLNIKTVYEKNSKKLSVGAVVPLTSFRTTRYQLNRFSQQAIEEVGYYPSRKAFNIKTLRSINSYWNKKALYMLIGYLPFRREQLKSKDNSRNTKYAKRQNWKRKKKILNKHMSPFVAIRHREQ